MRWRQGRGAARVSPGACSPHASVHSRSVWKDMVPEHKHSVLQWDLALALRDLAVAWRSIKLVLFLYNDKDLLQSPSFTESLSVCAGVTL